MEMAHWSGLRENLTCSVHVSTHRGGREGWVWYGSQAGRATWPHWSPCWMRDVSMDSLNHGRDRNRISWLCSTLAHVFCSHSVAIFWSEINMHEWTLVNQCIKEQWNPKPMLPQLRLWFRADTKTNQYFPDFKRNIKNPFLFITTVSCKCESDSWQNLNWT